MISYIKGKVLFSEEDSVAIVSGGVGWDVNVYSGLDYPTGVECEAFCYTHFSQDKIAIWGVKSIDELVLLRRLVSISGIGPRTAVNLIGNLGVLGVRTAIDKADIKALKIKGLGEKGAQKIILELKGKIDFNSSASNSSRQYSGKVTSIMNALMKLGYSKESVKTFVDTVGVEYLGASDESKIISDFLKNNYE